MIWTALFPWRTAQPPTSRTFWWLLGLTFGALLALAMLAAPLANVVSPSGITSLALARDPTSASFILFEWERTGHRFLALADIAADTLLLLPLSVALLAVAVSWCLAQADDNLWPVRVKRAARYLPLLVGGGHLVENLCLAVTVLTRDPGPWVQIAWLATELRFAAWLVAGLLCLTAVLDRSSAVAVLKVLWLLRFSLMTSVLASAVFLMPGQSREVLRVTGSLLPGERLTTVALVLMAPVFAAISWCWARALINQLAPQLLPDRTIQPNASNPLGAAVWTALYVPRLCAIGPLLAIALGFYLVSHSPEASLTGTGATLPEPIRFPDLEHLHVLLLTAVFLLEAIAAAWLLQIRRNRWVPRGLSNRGDRFPLKLAIASLFPGVVLWLVLAVWPDNVHFAQGLGPGATVLLGLTIFIPGGSLLVWAGHKTHVPWLEGLAILVLTFGALDLNDNHAVRLLGSEPAPPEVSVPLNQRFEAWVAARPDLDKFVTKGPRGYQGCYPVFFVSLEGGGIRAAFQGAHTLSQLQDDARRAHRDFAAHTFAISGVSGGSVGAALFAALVSRYDSPPPGTPVRPLRSSYTDLADQMTAADLLSPELGCLLSTEMAQRALPFTWHNADGAPHIDRAVSQERALEQAFTAATGGGHELGLPLSRFGSSFARRNVPALYLNSTNVESGSRLVMSTLPATGAIFCNDQPPEAGAAHFDTGYTQHDAPTSLDGTGLNLRMSTAAVLSARFPLVMPSGYLAVTQPLRPEDPNDPARARFKFRFVDGGYFESSGITTLQDVVAALRGPSSNGIPWRAVVLRIGFAGLASPNENPLVAFQDAQDKAAFDRDLRGRYGLAGLPSPGEALARSQPNVPRRSNGWDELLSPSKAALNAGSGGHASAAYRRFGKDLADAKNEGGLIPGKSPQLYEIEFTQHQTDLPLGWLMGEAGREDLTQQCGTLLTKADYQQELSALTTEPSTLPVKLRQDLARQTGPDGWERLRNSVERTAILNLLTEPSTCPAPAPRPAQ